jgi:CheY-like chemotaxis protein
MPLILVTEDDAVQLGLWKLVLETAGHRVVTALGSGGALRHLEAARPDLLILDLRLLNAEGTPDAREGMRLIRRIREAGCPKPVIVLSGWPEQLYGQPEETLVSRVMVKPVAAAELLQAVDELLA